VLGLHFLDCIQCGELDQRIKKRFPGRREIQASSKTNAELETLNQKGKKQKKGYVCIESGLFFPITTHAISYHSSTRIS
jgi:hypothetical protein